MKKDFNFASAMASSLGEKTFEKLVGPTKKIASDGLFFDLKYDVLSLCEDLRKKGFLRQASQLEEKFYSYKKAELDLEGDSILDKAHPKKVELKDVDGDTEIENLTDHQKKVLEIVRKKKARVINRNVKNAQEGAPALEGYTCYGNDLVQSTGFHFSSALLQGANAAGILADIKAKLQKKSEECARLSDVKDSKNVVDIANSVQRDVAKNKLAQQMANDAGAIGFLILVCNRETSFNWKTSPQEWLRTFFNKYLTNTYTAPVVTEIAAEAVQVSNLFHYANYVGNAIASHPDFLTYADQSKNVVYFDPKKLSFVGALPEGDKFSQTGPREDLNEKLPDDIKARKLALEQASDFFQEKTIKMRNASVTIFVPKQVDKDGKNKYQYRRSLTGQDFYGDADNLFVGENAAEDRSNAALSRDRTHYAVNNGNNNYSVYGLDGTYYGNFDWKITDKGAGYDGFDPKNPGAKKPAPQYTGGGGGGDEE